MSETNYSGLFLFFILTLLSEILGTIGGFGSSLFFVSLSQFFFGFQTVLALTGMLHVFSNVAKIILFRKTIDWKLVLWLGVSSTVLALAGSLLTTIANLQYAHLALGVFLIGFSVFFFWKPNFKINPSIKNSIVGGSIAGFLAGFIGTGGAIRGLVLTSFNMEKTFLVGTSAAIDFGVDIVRTIVYLENNYLEKSMWILVPTLIFASFLGSYLGKILLAKISQETFRKVLLALVLIMGLFLIAGWA
ncbi:MAG TPA: sulfite exporter TauE/SafE family protein [Cyclobacteriaceae bacterium]|nr:sulfite exporter TauE/SafE family protein [Cyclobacteriaceae bacterium]